MDMSNTMTSSTYTKHDLEGITVQKGFHTMLGEAKKESSECSCSAIIHKWNCYNITIRWRHQCFGCKKGFLKTKSKINENMYTVHLWSLRTLNVAWPKYDFTKWPVYKQMWLPMNNTQTKAIDIWIHKHIFSNNKQIKHSINNMVHVHNVSDVHTSWNINLKSDFLMYWQMPQTITFRQWHKKEDHITILV